MSNQAKILVGLIILYIIVFGLVSCFRHYNFQTQTWDMGVFVQTFWNTVHGRVMFNNLEEADHHFGVHMSPWLFVLVPGYAIFSSPYYLLIIQTIFLGLAAWPLYLLAVKILENRNQALLVALSYLLYPSLHWINLFDFHEIAFFIPLFLAAFYFFEKRKYLWSLIFFLASASTKENAILAVAFAGIYLFLRKSREDKFIFLKKWTIKKDKFFGTAIFFICLIFFIVSIKFIMPALGGGLLRFDRYANLGNSPSEIITNISQNPSILTETILEKSKLVYFMWVFLPVAFLPFFVLLPWLLIFPGLLQNMLTSFGSQFSGLYQYDAVIIPAVFIALVFALKKIKLRWPKMKKPAVAVLIVCMSIAFFSRSPVSPFVFPIDLFKTRQRWQVFRQMVKRVPEEVSVSAHTNLVPHLSQREHAYQLGQEDFLVDVVLFDRQNFFGFASIHDFQDYIDSYLNSGEYEVEVIEERYAIIYRKKVELDY